MRPITKLSWQKWLLHPYPTRKKIMSIGIHFFMNIFFTQNQVAGPYCHFAKKVEKERRTETIS
jgi:hypothetical protein